MRILELSEVVDCWRSFGENTTVDPPATEAQLQSAEVDLGRPLPAELRALYAICNGAYIGDGNLQIWPLRGKQTTAKNPFTGQMQVFTSHGVVDHHRAAPMFTEEQLSKVKQVFAPAAKVNQPPADSKSRLERHEDVLLFADNGSDDKYGVWHPSTQALEVPIPATKAVITIGGFDLQHSDLAANSIREWCTAATLVALQVEMYAQRVQPESLAFFGISAATPTLQQEAIKELLAPMLFSGCDPHGEGRSFERTRNLVNARGERG